MAGLAGFQPVVQVDPRIRVFHPLDLVGAVAVETLGGVAVAEPGNLAVIGVEVGFKAVLVAVAAVFGDLHAGAGAVDLPNAVAVVAVGADGSAGVTGRPLLAVHGGLVQFELVAVTLAAHVRQIQVVLGARQPVDRLDVMRTVAVVAGGVGARLVVDARARMQGIHVAFDVLHDVLQIAVIGTRLAGLRFAPFLEVTGHTPDLAIDVLAVRHFRDVFMTPDAFLPAVHAGVEVIGPDVQIPLHPIGALAREPLAAVAAQALVAGQLGVGGRGGKGGGQEQAQSQHQQSYQRGANPGVRQNHLSPSCWQRRIVSQSGAR